MSMSGPSSLRLVIFSLCLVAVAGSLGCKKKEDPATAATRHALEEVKGQVAKLRKEASELRARVNALPDDLPSLDAVRSKLSSVEEVLGTEAARVEWLSGELGAAIASGSKEKLAEISETIRGSVEGSKRLAKPVMEVAQDLLPLEHHADGGNRG